MIPYLLLYFSVSIGSIYNVFVKRSNEILFLILVIILGIFSGSRVTTLGGYDTDVYKMAYEEVPSNFFAALEANTFFLSSMEKGYILLNWAAKSIGMDFNEFLLCIGILTSLGLYSVFRKYSKYYFVVLLIFISKGYLYYFFTAQRQVIAMIICWYSIHFILNRKLWPFVISVILAAQFHTSSIIFIIAYFCTSLRFKNNWAIIIVVCSTIIGFSNVGMIVGEFFSNYLPGEQYSEKLTNYLENSAASINIFNFIEIIPIFFITLNFRNKIEERLPHFNFFFNFFLIFICLTFAFYNFQFIARLKGYFIIGYIFIITSFLYIAPRKLKLGILITIILYCLAVFVRELVVFDDGEGYLPYEAFWL